MANRITKAMPAPVLGRDSPLAALFDAQHHRYPETADVRALYHGDPQVKEIIDTARTLEGLKRQWGVHAAGVIISSMPLIDIIPIHRTQLDRAACEALGLLKMDLLGLRNLTVIDDAMRNIAVNNKQPPDLDAVESGDAKTYALLSQGDTVGVFQLDGARCGICSAGSGPAASKHLRCPDAAPTWPDRHGRAS